jgi:hypothetical protein
MMHAASGCANAAAASCQRLISLLRTRLPHTFPCYPGTPPRPAGSATRAVQLRQHSTDPSSSVRACRSSSVTCRSAFPLPGLELHLLQAARLARQRLQLVDQFAAARSRTCAQAAMVPAKFEIIGGRTRARPLNPLIKRHRGCNRTAFSRLPSAGPTSLGHHFRAPSRAIVALAVSFLGARRR